MGNRHDRLEFGRLFEGAARRLWVVASATAPTGQVDDVLQESLLIGLRRFSSFESGTNFGAWMATIVRNVALGEARKDSRRSRRVSVEDVADDLADQLDAGQHEFGEQLEAALRTLSPDARACLLLHVVEGMSQAEVAQLLTLPEGTVASHVHRARASLRVNLTSGPQAPSREVCDESRELSR